MFDPASAHRSIFALCYLATEGTEKEVNWPASPARSSSHLDGFSCCPERVAVWRFFVLVGAVARTRSLPASAREAQTTPFFLRVLCVLRRSAQRKVSRSEPPTLGFLRQPNLRFGARAGAQTVGFLRKATGPRRRSRPRVRPWPRGRGRGGEPRRRRRGWHDDPYGEDAAEREACCVWGEPGDRAAVQGEGGAGARRSARL